MSSSHPRLFARGTPPRFVPKPDARIRVLVYAPAPECVGWIEEELARDDVIMQVARSVRDLVSALVEDPPPRPQLLVADLDAMNAGELLHLHAIREQGWFGTIVGLGTVPLPLRASLGVEKVIAAPYPRNALRAAVMLATYQVMSTIRIPRITG
jgi:hypothetical protein